MMKKNPPVHQLYSKYILQKNNKNKTLEESIADLWGSIPYDIKKAAEEIKKKNNNKKSSHELDQLQKEIKKNMHTIGILTDDTSKQIDKMQEGVIESGQQPNCLGGSSLTLNKIIYANILAKEASIVPLHYVADYDGLRAELINTRTPSLSTSGLAISYPNQHQDSHMPIYKLRNPSEKWLRNTLEKIEETYKNLIKNTANREHYLQNLRQALTIIKNAYFSTENVSEFSTKILGILINLESNSPTPIYWFSMPNTRHLFQKGYEHLLKDQNRTHFIQASNNAVETIEKLGYTPQIGRRTKNYIPFYLECTECNKERIDLQHSLESDQIAQLSGKCPKCGTVYEYSYDPNKPDLTDIIKKLTPRVDSRQIIVNSVIPVIAHIVGPSESSYFAEVTPAARALKLPFPIVMRYTRIFYNVPWTEPFTQKLRNNGLTPMANESLFNSLGKWVKAKNSKDENAIFLAHKEIQLAISSSYRNICQHRDQIESKIIELKQIKDKEHLRENIKKTEETQRELSEIDLYLSWTYGRFNKDKFGQEVNWNWLDIATITGVKDLITSYERVYNEYTPNASMFFLNTR